MQAITLDPVRWQEEPARITVLPQEKPKTCFQVTAPRNIEEMCVGRPAEELPRILSILSPSHHLAAARTLDSLYGVEPPVPAQNMRRGLLVASTFAHHLKKLSFLLSSLESPFEGHHAARRRERAPAAHRMLDEAMRHASLSREAASILGGRADHPLSAVAGGVSRFLKKDHYVRLEEIAEACNAFAVRLADYFQENIWKHAGIRNNLLASGVGPLPALTLEEDGKVLVYGNGKGIHRFSPEETFEKIELRRERWSYTPFARLKEHGGEDFSPLPEIEGLAPGACFFVGPLARFNAGSVPSGSSAREELQRLADDLGPFPHHSPLAACRCLMVELTGAAQEMKDLYAEPNFLGPFTRTVPTERGREGHGALESPEGCIFHRLETDERGVVRGIQVLDAAMANHALRCFLVQKTAESFLGRRSGTNTLKKALETSLLPF